MPSPAIYEDVAARWRPLTTAESLVAETLLDDAWALVTARRPALEQNIADGKIAEANVIRVLCAMVIRVLSNPDGKLEESVDDYRYRRDSLVSSGALVVTDDELSDLSVSGGRRSNSVRLVAYGER